MGYRSDVAVVIYGDGRDPEKYALLKTLMNTTFKEAYTEFDGNAEWHDYKYVLEFAMKSVKWYDGHGEVQRFMKMLEDIVDIKGFNYEFMRIGEDDGDIERHTGGENAEYILSVTREIQVDL